MKYVNAVLGRNCYEELAPLFAKTNNPSKEISESYGAFHHMRNSLAKDNLKLDDFFFLHIGDGSTGRTGALFTFMSKSANISIDPATNKDFMARWRFQFKVKNYEAVKSTWQKYRPNFILDKVSYNKPNLGIVLVHSHVRTIDIMNAFQDWKYIYVNKCCDPANQLLTTQQMEKLNIGVCISGSDNMILSQEKDVIVYRNNKMFEESE
jgi:hypothetical protein